MKTIVHTNTCKNNIEPAIDKTTIILAIEFLAINGLKSTIPAKVRIDANKDNTEKTAH